MFKYFFTLRALKLKLIIFYFIFAVKPPKEFNNIHKTLSQKDFNFLPATSSLWLNKQYIGQMIAKTLVLNLSLVSFAFHDISKFVFTLPIHTCISFVFDEFTCLNITNCRSVVPKLCAQKNSTGRQKL